MKHLIILFIGLFLTGCYDDSPPPQLNAGDCYSNNAYSEYISIVVKPISSKYNTATQFITLSYRRVNPNKYFHFNVSTEFSPVRLEKCEYVQRISSRAKKSLEHYDLWKQFKEIVQKIEEN